MIRIKMENTVDRTTKTLDCEMTQQEIDTHLNTIRGKAIADLLSLKNVS